MNKSWVFVPRREYVRDNWNKISNKAEYCLSVLLKEVEILPGMIGEEKEDE